MSIQILADGRPLLVPAAGDFTAFIRLTQGGERPITSISSGVLTTKTPHCLKVGDKIVVDHCGCSGGMAGFYEVGTVASDYTFTLAGNPVADSTEADPATFAKPLDMTGLQLLVDLSFEDAIVSTPFAAAKVVNGERSVLLEGQNPFHVGQSVVFPDPPLSGFSAKIVGGSFPPVEAKVCGSCGETKSNGCGCGSSSPSKKSRGGNSVIVLDKPVTQTVADRWAIVMSDGLAVPSSIPAGVTYWNPTTGLADATAGFAKIHIPKSALKPLQDRLGRLLCGKQLPIGCWHARIAGGYSDPTQPDINFAVDEQPFGSGALIYS